MKRILDPAFCYVPSFATDVRQTFERARRERGKHCGSFHDSLLCMGRNRCPG